MSERTWGYETQTALADILHASFHRTDLRIRLGAELGEFPDNYFKDLGKPRFLTAVELAAASHVES